MTAFEAKCISDTANHKNSEDITIGYSKNN